MQRMRKRLYPDHLSHDVRLSGHHRARLAEAAAQYICRRHMCQARQALRQFRRPLSGNIQPIRRRSEASGQERGVTFWTD